MLDSIVEVLPRNERELLHMARKANVLPSYLLHTQSGQARVRISGRDYLLGLYGSESSRIAYGELIAKFAGGIPIDPILIATARRHFADNALAIAMLHRGRPEVLLVSGTGESLILSHRKDLEDGSEEDRIEVKRHTPALHR
jgi:hypothetical protein